MKLTSLLLLVFILCMLQSNAQEFQKRYIDTSSIGFLYHSATALSDTGILIVSNGFTQPMGPRILKLDQYGNILNEVKISTSNWATETTLSYSPTAIEGTDKTLTVAYNSGSWDGGVASGLRIIQLDSNLNVNWGKVLPGGNMAQYQNITSIGEKVFGVINNGIDSIGANSTHYYKSGIAVCGLNNNGSTIFSNTYFGENTNEIFNNSITSNLDKNLIVCANISNYTKTSQYDFLRGTIVEIDTAGFVLRAINTVNMHLATIEQDKHGNYVVLGTILINDTPRYTVSLLDRNFNIQWSKTLIDLDARDRLSALLEDDTIYLFSKHSVAGDLNLAITKIDYSGNALEAYYYNYPSSLYMSASKSKNGNFLFGDLLFSNNKRDYLLRSSKSLTTIPTCTTIEICVPRLIDFPLQLRNIIVTMQPHTVSNITANKQILHTNVEDYCIPVGILDASFTLAKDTFCSGEQFDLRSNPQLLSGESIWQITGPDNFTYVAKDTLGLKLDKAGSYTVVHLHKVAFCTDSFSRNITVLGGASTVSITTCDTIRAAQISNCPFTWPDGSSDSIYIATSSGTWNISTQCAVCTSNVAVHINVTPKPYLLEKATDICEGKTLPYTLKGQYISDALWTDGSTGTSYSFDSAGTYPLVLYNNGCMHADTLSVNMIDCRTCDIYLPNAFTPNGDGNNDAFGAYTNCTQIIQFSLQVYNRWGEKVYDTNDLNAAWDATYKGQAAPAATYVYYVSISYNTATDAETKKYKGSVMLIR